MVSREKKRAAKAMYKKLKQLRSITKSQAHSKRSIILGASKYIEELKQKVEKMNQGILAAAQNSTSQNRLPMLKVEALEKGNFVIKVFTERSCQGLLVFILEAFEELGLDVLQARVSCSDNFLLEAVGVIREHKGNPNHVDVQVVKQAVLQAIQRWSEVNEP